MTEIFLPFPPSVNEMFGNNKSGKGRGRYRTSEYDAWVYAASAALNKQNVPAVEGRCIVHIDLDDRRMGDADNRTKGLLDFLVDQGVLKGDSKKWLKRVSIGWEKIDGCRVAISEVA